MGRDRGFRIISASELSAVEDVSHGYMLIQIGVFMLKLDYLGNISIYGENFLHKGAKDSLWALSSYPEL